MILDAGVLISIERDEGAAGELLLALDRRGAAVHTSEPVVGQVWRNGARQARLAHALRNIRIHPFLDGRTVGRLLGESGTSDVVDAHLVILAAQLGEPLLTGDPDDLRRLADVFGPLAPRIHAWP